MQFIAALLLLIVCAVVIAIVTLLVVVDMAGKIDYIKTNFPRVVKWAESREWHGFLLLICLGLLAVDAYELFTKEMPDLEPPKVTLQFGGMADRDAEIVKLRTRLEAQNPTESSNSLRRRTLRLIDELNVFWGKRPYPLLKIQTPTTDDERERNAKWDKYWVEADIAYRKADYRDRLLRIIREYKAKGLPTGLLETDFEQENRLVGAEPFGGTAVEEDCFRSMTDLCVLRELAYHVDSQDLPILLTEK